MSCDTRCNFCTLRDLKVFAVRTNRELTVISNRPCSDNDAVSSYLNSGGISKRDLVGNDVFIGGVFAAWLWNIPDHCVCHEE